MKLTRQLIIMIVSFFFVLTLSVNAQETKTKKETKTELKKIQRVYKVSTSYENTKVILKTNNTESDSIVGTKTLSKNPDFDLTTTKINRVVEKDKGTKKDLNRKNQRVFQVSTSPEALTLSKKKNSESDSIVKIKKAIKKGKTEKLKKDN